MILISCFGSAYIICISLLFVSLIRNDNSTFQDFRDSRSRNFCYLRKQWHTEAISFSEWILSVYRKYDPEFMSLFMQVFLRSLSKKPGAYLLHTISVAHVVAWYHTVSPAPVITPPNHALLFKYMDICHPITMQRAACLSNVHPQLSIINSSK